MPPLDFSGRRLDLANAFRYRATAKQAARELGTETGSVFGLIRRMHDEGIIESDSDPDPPTRGTQYRLSHKARIALDELMEQAVDQPDEAGKLTENQRLLIVRGEAFAELERVLADPGLSANVAWASWVGAGWLVAMIPDCSSHSWRRLATAIEESGNRCELGKVDEPQLGRHWREQSESNLERARAVR
jgi:DNA-binding PadR family transcriptional regulator